MKKSWLPALALSLGWIASTTAFGQYPNAQNNFGPSSYPVQQQAGSMLQSLPQVPQQQYQSQQYPSQQYPQAGQFQAGNSYQQTSPYQLVATQNQQGAAYGQPAQVATEQVPVPAPMRSQPMQPNMPAPQQNLQGSQQSVLAPQQNVLGSQQYQQSQQWGPECTSCQTQPAQSYQPPVDYGYNQVVAPNASGYTPNYFGGNAYAGNSQVFGRPLQTGLGGGHVGGGLPCGAKPWFFGAGALVFQRIDNHSVPLTLSGYDYNADLLTTQSARMGTTGGFEASVGRYFNCGKNAIQASYWGLYPSEQSELRTGMPGELRTRIPFQFVEMQTAPTMPMPTMPYAVADWFNNARAHELRRSSNYHNVEVNLLGFAAGGAARNFNMSTAGSLFSGSGHAGHGSSCGYCGGAGCGACSTSAAKYATGPCGLIAPTCGSRLNVSWLGGFRYFHFTDNLQYAASLNDRMIDRSDDDLYYNVDATNDLFGFQLGSRMDYCLGRRVNLYGTSKAGVYNNHSRMLTRLGTDQDIAYLNDTRTLANPGNGGEYNFDESKDTIAFMGEIGSGVGVRLSPKWTGTVGYRAIYVSGVATAPDNVRETFANYDDIANYNTSSSLILHGLNVGALYNF